MGKSAPPQIPQDFQSLPPSSLPLLTPELSRMYNSHTDAKIKENKQGMARERQKFVEALSSFKSLVWDHVGFGVKYNGVRVKTVNSNLTANIA